MAEYGATRFPFAFTVPRGTFILSFSEPGSTTCVGRRIEDYIQTKTDMIRQMLYLHGADEFTDHRDGSIFARTLRATGSSKEPIMFPNVNYTFEPDVEGAPRDQNIYGVYSIGNSVLQERINTNSLISQFDPSLPADTTNKQDWVLGDIIQRVYEVTGTRAGIFLNLGCQTPCHGADSSMDKAGDLVRYADVMYRNIIPVVSGANVKKTKQELFTDTTHELGRTLNAMEPSTFTAMLAKGIYDPREFLDTNVKEREFHYTDFDTIKSIAQGFIDHEERKSKLRSNPKKNPKFVE
jgi:hypothetical protein